jgi:hypothetical protein
MARIVTTGTRPKETPATPLAKPTATRSRPVPTLQEQVEELQQDVEEISASPRELAVLTFDTLGDPALHPQSQAYMSDEAGGPQPVFSDGVAWRRIKDGVKVSKLPKTIMFNGQSNMAARVPVTAGYSAMLRFLGPDILGFNHTTQSFTPVIDGSAHARANYAGGTTALAATKVWQVDASGPTFVDETTDFNSAGNADVQLIVAGEEVGDYVAFGFGAKFQRLMFDYANGTAGVGGAVAWEYLTATGWKALTGVADETNGFKAAAADGRQVSWTVPGSDWTAQSLNASSQFYVRARVTTIYSTNPIFDQGFIGPSGSTGSGPGLGQIGTLLARRIAASVGATAEDPIRTYALAYPSQGIAYFRKLSATKAFFEDGSQHGTLNNYDLLKSYVDVTGIVPERYVWCQGEADSGMTQAAYYAEFSAHVADLRADYPGIKILVIGTIGNGQQRSIDANGAGVGTIAGVFAAQKQFCDEHPDYMLFLDNRDMSGFTAWWGGKYTGNHYTDYAGFEECGERCFALLQGRTRPPVMQIMHLDDALVWTNRFLYIRSISGTGFDVQWQGQMVAESLVAHTNTPAHIPYDAEIGYRSPIDFDAANAETLKKTGLAATNDWSVFVVAKGDLLGANKDLIYLQSADVNNRVALNWCGGSNAHKYFYNSGDASFTPEPYAADVTAWHTYMFVLNTTGTTVSLYIDGALYGSATINGSEVNMTELWIASILNTSNFDGRIVCVAYALGVVADATAALKAHKWADVEFKFHEYRAYMERHGLPAAA